VSVYIYFISTALYFLCKANFFYFFNWLLNRSSSHLPAEIENDMDVMKYAIRGSDDQWNQALRKSEGVINGLVQIKTIESRKTFPKRKLSQNDIEKELMGKKSAKVTMKSSSKKY